MVTVKKGNKVSHNFIKYKHIKRYILTCLSFTHRQCNTEYRHQSIRGNFWLSKNMYTSTSGNSLGISDITKERVPGFQTEMHLFMETSDAKITWTMFYGVISNVKLWITTVWVKTTVMLIHHRRYDISLLQCLLRCVCCCAAGDSLPMLCCIASCLVYLCVCMCEQCNKIKLRTDLPHNVFLSRV